MKKGGIIVLVLMWTATLTLLAVTAMNVNAVDGRKLPQMTGSETGFVSVEQVQNEQSGENERCKISGCLSESEIASLIFGASDGILGEVAVKTGTHKMTVFSSIAADAETVIERYPQTADALLILRLMKNAPIEASAKMEYDAENGLTATDVRVSVHGVDLSDEDAAAGGDMLLNELRYFLDSGKTEWQRLELLPGGLYYTCVTDRENAENIFKAKEKINDDQNG